MELADELDRNMKLCLTISFTIATLFTFGYLFIGSIIFIYGALGVYAFSFSMLTLAYIRKLFQLSAYKDRLARIEKSMIDEGQDVEAFRAKKEEILKVSNSIKRKEIFKAILSGAFGIFTIVVLVLF